MSSVFDVKVDKRLVLGMSFKGVNESVFDEKVGLV